MIINTCSTDQIIALLKQSSWVSDKCTLSLCVNKIDSIDKKIPRVQCTLAQGAELYLEDMTMAITDGKVETS